MSYCRVVSSATFTRTSVDAKDFTSQLLTMLLALGWTLPPDPKTQDCSPSQQIAVECELPNTRTQAVLACGSTTLEPKWVSPSEPSLS